MMHTFIGGELNGQRLEVIDGRFIHLNAIFPAPSLYAIEGELWPARNLRSSVEVYEKMWNGSAYVFMFAREIKI